MPLNGEINNHELGIYRSVCCGEEIVIIAGARFPDCPNHPNLPTKWKSVRDDRPIPHVLDLKESKKKSA